MKAFEDMSGVLEGLRMIESRYYFGMFSGTDDLSADGDEYKMRDALIAVIKALNDAIPTLPEVASCDGITYQSDLMTAKRASLFSEWIDDNIACNWEIVEGDSNRFSLVCAGVTEYDVVEIRAWECGVMLGVL